MSDDLLDFEYDNLDSDDRRPSGWSYLSGDGLIKCVFSTTKAMKMGMGASASTRDSRNFWFVEQEDKDTFRVRMINNHHVPTGDAEFITMQDLIGDYTPELAYYETKVLPAMLELEKDLGPGDERRERVGLKREQACSIEEKNITALFGLGLIYLTRQEENRTQELLGELLKMKTTFDGKPQHLFNEFGIALRKSGLYTEAVGFFERALEFVTDDEHLFYNLARAHYENNNWDGCLDNLILCHRLNPDLGVARNLLEVMVGLEDNPERQMRYGKPAVPSGIASRARQILSSSTGRLKLDEQPVAVASMGVERNRARSGSSSVGFVEFKRHGGKE